MRCSPPAPGRLQFWDLPGCPVSPWELGVLQDLKAPFIQFQHFSSLRRPAAGSVWGGDDLSKMLLLLWGVIPFWMETPPPHWCLCHFLGLNLQSL